MGTCVATRLTRRSDEFGGTSSTRLPVSRLGCTLYITYLAHDGRRSRAGAQGEGRAREEARELERAWWITES